MQSGLPKKRKRRRTTIGQRRPKKSQLLKNKGKKYYVESILKIRRKPHEEKEDPSKPYAHLLYLIKWKGYGATYNTWEPAQNLNPKLLKRLHEGPDAVRDPIGDEEVEVGLQIKDAPKSPEKTKEPVTKQCQMCYGTGASSDMLMCSACGDCYHDDCVIGAPSAQNAPPDWRCNTCAEANPSQETSASGMHCSRCNRHFKGRQGWRRHMKMHAENDDRRTPTPPVALAEDVAADKLPSSQKKQLRCPYCSCYMKGRPAFVKHMMTHQKNPPPQIPFSTMPPMVASTIMPRASTAVAIPLPTSAPLSASTLAASTSSSETPLATSVVVPTSAIFATSALSSLSTAIPSTSREKSHHLKPVPVRTSAPQIIATAVAMPVRMEELKRGLERKELNPARGAVSSSSHKRSLPIIKRVQAFVDKKKDSSAPEVKTVEKKAQSIGNGFKVKIGSVVLTVPKSAQLRTIKDLVDEVRAMVKRHQVLQYFFTPPEQPLSNPVLKAGNYPAPNPKGAHPTCELVELKLYEKNGPSLDERDLIEDVIYEDEIVVGDCAMKSWVEFHHIQPRLCMPQLNT